MSCCCWVVPGPVQDVVVLSLAINVCDAFLEDLRNV